MFHDSYPIQEQPAGLAGVDCLLLVERQVTVVDARNRSIRLCKSLAAKSGRTKPIKIYFFICTLLHDKHLSKELLRNNFRQVRRQCF